MTNGAVGVASFRSIGPLSPLAFARLRYFDRGIEEPSRATQGIRRDVEPFFRAALVIPWCCALYPLYPAFRTPPPPSHPFGGGTNIDSYPRSVKRLSEENGKSGLVELDQWWRSVRTEHSWPIMLSSKHRLCTSHGTSL